MINNDIVTFKKIVRLFEMNNLLFLLNHNGSINLFTILKQIKKSSIVKDLYKLLTGRDNCSFKELFHVIKEFVEEKKYQDEQGSFLLNEMMKYNKAKPGVNDVNSNNQYLDLQLSLGNIGNHDCSKLAFDEGLFILLEHNKKIHEENRKIEKK
jgi:hypothetical protein